jgi:hypothetical protein
MAKSQALSEYQRADPYSTTKRVDSRRSPSQHEETRRNLSERVENAYKMSYSINREGTAHDRERHPRGRVEVLYIIIIIIYYHVGVFDLRSSVKTNRDHAADRTQ